MGVVADDLEAQTAFYRDVLGFRQTEAGDGWVQFDVDGRMFEVLERSSLPQYDARRFQVGFTVADIEATRESLIKAGAEPISDIEGGGETENRWCYFRDPEGNVFELTEWRGVGPAGRAGAGSTSVSDPSPSRTAPAVKPSR
jgi:catechol 2,3-dioxygenase-like lactoylglutathione lyase family enzyme